MKVSVGGNEVHTGQIFFNETITRTVYKQKPYAARGTYDTPHAQDVIYRQAGGSKAELKLKRRTGGLNGLRRNHRDRRRHLIGGRSPRRAESGLTRGSPGPICERR